MIHTILSVIFLITTAVLMALAVIRIYVAIVDYKERKQINKMLGGK